MLIRFEPIDEVTLVRRLDDVRARLAKVELPDEAEDPTVRKLSSYSLEPVVAVVVEGEAPERQTHRLASDLERELRDVPGFDDLAVFGKRDRALLMERDPRQLDTHRLDVDIVRRAPRRQEEGSRWWERVYVALLRRFLPARYLVVGSLLLPAATVALIPLIGIDLLGAEEISIIGIYVEMPDGTRLERTEEVLREYDRRAMGLDPALLEGVTINAGLHQGGEE